jgi:hypothetical protein
VTTQYTIAEANRTLPYVSSIVGEIRERYQTIQDRGQRHNALPKNQKDGRAALKGEIQAEARRIHNCVEELEAIGLELKDYELGLVDFPAELEGRSILLCWKYGEREVDHWHEATEGYQGRQRVPRDEPAWPASSGSRCGPAAPG